MSKLALAVAVSSSLFLILACSNDTDTPSQSSPVSVGWITARATYEGFPLYLRKPTEIDYSQAARYPTLVTITHTFTERMPSGLPEPDYNSSLDEFDEAVVSLFEEDGFGFTILVETYGGKRHYYHYVAVDAPVRRRFDELEARYPQHDLELGQRSDPAWNFRKKYTEEYGF